MTTTIDTPPAVLAPTLEQHARRYIAARTRSGDALLEAVAALADARAAAAHGEWGIFLAAVGLDDSRARALIRLHDACLADRALADRVRSGWLSEAAARELLPAPAEVRAAVLDAAAPPTLADVREAKRAAGGQTAGLASADDTYVSKVRALLEGLEVWHDSIRPDVIRDARKQAAEVRNDALRAALLAEIAQADRAATPDLPPSRKICPTCAEPILNGIWGPREECGECWHNERLNTPKRALPPGFTPTPQVAAPLPPLPPLPDPLCYTWTRWRNEDGQIGMRHVSGYTFAGTDLGEIEDLARHLSRPLAELYDHAWRVSYDPGAEGHADLHAYTGTHEAFDAISAPTIQQLALAAWWARQTVDDVPDMPDDVIDALWLAGYDWSGTAWVRGFERIEEDANLNELRYQLGLTSAAPVADVPHLPEGWADATARANRLGLYLGMNMAGVFSLSNLSGSVLSRIESWPDVLALLLELKEAAATRAAPAAKALDWRAVARLTAKLGGGQDTDPAATYRAIGMLLAAGGVLPALPTRPRPPRSADVSEQLAYLGQLETYVEALERHAGVRE